MNNEWAKSEYYFDAFEKEAIALVANAKRKHRDYGESIGFHGAKGLLPRLSDKFFRVNHIVWDGENPNFESAIDSALDLASYAIGLAVALKYEQGMSKQETRDLLTFEFSSDREDYRC